MEIYDLLSVNSHMGWFTWKLPSFAVISYEESNTCYTKRKKGKKKKNHFLWSLINGVGGGYLMENTYRDIKVPVSNDVTSRVLHPCQNCKVNSLQSKYGLTSCDT